MSFFVFAESCTLEGATQCSGQAEQICQRNPDNSLTWNTFFTCPSGQNCQKQPDNSLICVGTQCSGSESQCNGNILQTCSNGLWNSGTNCGTQACVQDNFNPPNRHASCQAVQVCNPGPPPQSKCVGGLIYACNSQGTDWNPSSCGTDLVCTTISPTLAQCTCTLDDQKCDGQYAIKTCNGFSWPSSPCPSGQICTSTPNVHCEAAPVCNSGDTRCDPSDPTLRTPQTCDANKQWVSGSPCIYFCNQATGKCNECAPTATECRANVIYTCATGTMQAGTDCAALGKTCGISQTTGQAECQGGNQGDACTNINQNFCDGTKRCYCSVAGTKSCSEDCYPNSCVYDPTTLETSCVGTKTCNTNDQRCNSNTGNAEICNANNNGWDVKETCIPPKTCSYDGTTALCKTGIPPRLCDPPGKTQCNPSKPSADEAWVCTDQYLWNIKSCNGLGCDPTTQDCKKSSNPSPTCSTEGQKECNGNDIYTCTNKNWVLFIPCGSDKHCEQSGNSFSCVSNSVTPPPTPTPGGGSGGSSGGYTYSSSGGGAVTRCNKFTDWYAKDTKTRTENDASGRSRECKDGTEIRWCYLSSGAIDYSTYETRTAASCADWTEQCDYAYDRTEKYVDKSSNQCRDCSDEIFVLKCMPSGTTQSSNTKKKTTCSDWRTCNVSELASPSGNGNTQAQGGSELDSIVKQYGTVLGIVIVALVGVVAYTGWKMFTAKPE